MATRWRRTGSRAAASVVLAATLAAAVPVSAGTPAGAVVDEHRLAVRRSPMRPGSASSPTATCRRRPRTFLRCATSTICGTTGSTSQRVPPVDQRAHVRQRARDLPIGPAAVANGITRVSWPKTETSKVRVVLHDAPGLTTRLVELKLL